MRLYLEPHKIGDDRVWGCLGVEAGGLWGQVMYNIYVSDYYFLCSVWLLCSCLIKGEASSDEAVLLFAIIASWLGCWGVGVCLGTGSLFCGYMHVCHTS